MKVNIEFFGYLKKKFGTGKMKCEISEDIQEGMSEVSSIVHSILSGEPRLNYEVLVNGSNYKLAKERKKKLQDGDTLTFIPVVYGG